MASFDTSPTGGERPDAPSPPAWHRVGRHPTLELRHTVEDKLFVATHISFLPMRAMMHRNGDSLVCFSELVREVLNSGPSPTDRALVVTEKHVYLVALPSNVLFAPACAGSSFPLAEFARLCHVNGATHVVFQFIGGVLALRFQTPKDAARCGQAVQSLTGLPVETVTPQEVAGALARRGLNSIAMHNVDPSVFGGSSSEEETEEGLRPDDKHSDGRAVERIMRAIMESDTIGAAGAHGNDAWCQAAPQSAAAGIQAAPRTADAATSPTRPATPWHHSDDDSDRSELLAADYGDDPILRGFGPAPTGRTPDSDAVAAAAAAVLQGPTRRNSMLATPTRRGSVGRGDDSPTAAAVLPPRRSLNSTAGPEPRDEELPEPEPHDGEDLAAWLGVLSPYKQRFATQGIDSVGRFARLRPPELEEAMDTAGLQRAGHRVLLTNKVSRLRQGLS